VSRTVAQSLIQDAHGYLWVGAQDGPRLFDGLVWSAPAGLGPLDGCFVRAFVQASDQALWVGTDGAGLTRVDVSAPPYRTVTRVDVAAGLPSARIFSACVDARGRMWAGTNRGLAVVRDDAVERVYTPEDGLPSLNVQALCADEQGRLWVGTANGLVVIDDGVVRPVAGDGTWDPACRVHALCRDPHDRIWAALADGTVLRTGGARPDTPEAIYRSGMRVRALCADEQGRLWIGGNAGVRMLREDRLHDAWGVADGLPAKEVWALCADRDGRVWASTTTGLAVVEDQAVPLHALPAPAGLPPAPVLSCARDGWGRMWLATDAGVAVVDAVTEVPIALAALPPSVREGTVWTLQADQKGAMWVGTDHDGLYCLDPGSGAALAHIGVTPNVQLLYREGARRLWASMSGYGLVCVDVETRAVIHRILPQEQVQGLCTDAVGRLWAGTWSGWLACIDPEGGTVLRTMDLGAGGVPRAVLDLTLDLTGLLWVATHGDGLVCVDPERGAVVRALTPRDGLPSPIIYACHADHDGHIWAGTRRGVARYTPRTGRCVVLGRGMGLPGEECNGHALYLDERARLWVGTMQGVGIIETAHVPDDVPPCAVHLTGLSIMGQDREVTPGNILEIEDSDYDLVFGYGAVTFTAALQVAYRAQLVGLEGDWSALTPHRFARYTNLRPGTYTFRVAARNWGGRWSAPADISFRVIRNRAARELEEALERERIDKEVAQATAAVFERLALQDGLTGLLNRRALDERLAQEVDRARRHAHPLTVALADVDHFKRINDTYGHLVGDEALKAVAALCQATARGGDSIGRYGGEEIAFILPETAATEGLTVCERVRQAIADHDWAAIAPGLTVTISIGLSDWLDAPHPPKMLADADAHLYQAKQNGRNRVHGAPAPKPDRPS